MVGQPAAGARVSLKTRTRKIDGGAEALSRHHPFSASVSEPLFKAIEAKLRRSQAFTPRNEVSSGGRGQDQQTLAIILSVSVKTRDSSLLSMHKVGSKYSADLTLYARAQRTRAALTPLPASPLFDKGCNPMFRPWLPLVCSSKEFRRVSELRGSLEYK